MGGLLRLLRAKISGGRDPYAAVADGELPRAVIGAGCQGVGYRVPRGTARRDVTWRAGALRARCAAQVGATAERESTSRALELFPFGDERNHGGRCDGGHPEVDDNLIGALADGKLDAAEEALKAHEIELLDVDEVQLGATRPLPHPRMQPQPSLAGCLPGADDTDAVMARKARRHAHNIACRAVALHGSPASSLGLPRLVVGG